MGDDVKCDAIGNIYFCDFLNNAVRKVTPSGIITTIAGTGVAGYSGDGGPATAAQLRGPDAICHDPFGNIYISDADNHRIRRISASGIITTIAGTGVSGFGGDGGPASLANVDRPNDMVLDPAGDLYFCDIENHRVRKISGLSLLVPATQKMVMSLYPNPATDFVIVNAKTTINQLTVVTLEGKTVYSCCYNTSEVNLNVAALPAGLYFVNVNGTETREFIKK